MADQRRVYKVAEKIRSLLSRELYRTSNPHFGLVTITSIVVSPDLRIAKVYWTVNGEKSRIAETAQALESASGSFRRAVGDELGTRFVPHLKFFYDETLDRMEEVERLFIKIHEQDAKKE